jgi:hypothetical protein
MSSITYFLQRRAIFQGRIRQNEENNICSNNTKIRYIVLKWLWKWGFNQEIKKRSKLSGKLYICELMTVGIVLSSDLQEFKGIANFISAIKHTEKWLFSKLTF